AGLRRPRQATRGGAGELLPGRRARGAGGHRRAERVREDDVAARVRRPIKPTAGEIRVGGQQLKSPRRDVSMMFQAPTLLPWKTVLGNCLLPRELEHRIDEDDR